MRVRVLLEQRIVQARESIIEIDDAEFEEWCAEGGDGVGSERLIEFINAGRNVDEELDVAWNSGVGIREFPDGFLKIERAERCLP